MYDKLPPLTMKDCLSENIGLVVVFVNENKYMQPGKFM